MNKVKSFLARQIGLLCRQDRPILPTGQANQNKGLASSCRLTGPAIKKFYIYVVVNFLSQVIFIFLLFLGMLMYANEV